MEEHFLTILSKQSTYNIHHVDVIDEREKQATLSGVYKFELVRYRCMCYKYSTLPRGILINIAGKLGIFPEAEGRGKYSLPKVLYYQYSKRKG